MKKAFIILACEGVLLAAVVAAFLVNESPGVRMPPTFAAVAAPVRAPSFVPVSINLGASAGRVVTAVLRVRGGKAIAVTRR
jgi:hypothetical protein